MADKKNRLLDVWILEINTVYREVPFGVIADWLQQGRLLAEDRVRAAGAKTWHTIQEVPAFAAYLPRPEPLETGDEAESLEPVDLGFHWRRGAGDEDDDVDMIPLIDISLVLLIFFMMTATASTGFMSPINTPGAKHQLADISSDSYWVGVDGKGDNGQIEKDDAGKPRPWFSLGKDNQPILAATLEPEQIVQALAKNLEAGAGEVKVRLRADRDLPIEVIKGITLELQGLEQKLNRDRQPNNKLTLHLSGEVSEPSGQ